MSKNKPVEIFSPDCPPLKAEGFCLRDQADGKFYLVTLDGGTLIVGDECPDDCEMTVIKRNCKKPANTATTNPITSGDRVDIDGDVTLNGTQGIVDGAPNQSNKKSGKKSKKGK